MDDIKNISAALVKFHQETSGRVGFDSVNPFFKSKYASLGAVIDHISKHAPKHGLSWLQLPVSSQTKNMVGVKTIVLHESGESISSEIMLPINAALTRLNKEGDAYVVELETPKIAQEVGSVITYLRRYGLAAAFGLYADEDNDSNPAEPTNEKATLPASKVEPRGRAARPYKPDVLITKLEKMATKSEPANERDRQTLVAAIAQVVGDDDDNRHAIQEYLFGYESIKEVEPEMVSAAIAWLSPVYDKDLKSYLLNDLAIRELNLVIDEVL